MTDRFLTEDEWEVEFKPDVFIDEEQI